MQWIVYHVDMMQVDTIYLLDRFGTLLDGSDDADAADAYGVDFMRRLQQYRDAGRVVLVHFPFFSEMQARRSITSTRLALTYDQNIAYEHCLMMGRARSDRWMLFLDTDEFIRLGGGGGALDLPSAVESYASGAIATPYTQGDPRSISELYLDRFDMMHLPRAEDRGDAHAAGGASGRSIFRRFTFRSNDQQKKGRSILQPAIAQIMFMHAHVPYRMQLAGGHHQQQQQQVLSANPVTVWPPAGGIAGARAGTDAPLVLLEISHFTCLQVYPSDDNNCYCGVETICHEDEGVFRLADALDLRMRDFGS